MRLLSKLFLLLLFGSSLFAQNYYKEIIELGEKQCVAGCYTNQNDVASGEAAYSSCKSTLLDYSFISAPSVVTSYIEDTSYFPNSNYDSELCSPDGGEDDAWNTNSEYRAMVFITVITPVADDYDCSGGFCSEDLVREYESATTGGGGGDTGGGGGTTGTGGDNNYPICDDIYLDSHAQATTECQNQGASLLSYGCTDDGGVSQPVINYTCTQPNNNLTCDSIYDTSHADAVTACQNQGKELLSYNCTDDGGVSQPNVTYSCTSTTGTGGDTGTGDTGTGFIEGLLSDIKGALNDFFTLIKELASEAVPDFSELNSLINDLLSFIDGFAEEFTTMINDATAIKTEFDTLKSQLSGDDINKNINLTASSGSCNMGFTLMGQTFHPLASLPGILSPYSSIFSIMVYVAIMFFNFRLAFNRGL